MELEKRQAESEKLANRLEIARLREELSNANIDNGSLLLKHYHSIETSSLSNHGGVESMNGISQQYLNDNTINNNKDSYNGMSVFDSISHKNSCDISNNRNNPNSNMDTNSPHSSEMNTATNWFQPIIGIFGYLFPPLKSDNCNITIKKSIANSKDAARQTLNGTVIMMV